jgi:hypothetical protein
LFAFSSASRDLVLLSSHCSDARAATVRHAPAATRHHCCLRPAGFGHYRHAARLRW